MDDNWSWWAVYDMQTGEINIDDSNECDSHFISGESARTKAKEVAKKYIEILLHKDEV